MHFPSMIRQRLLPQIETLNEQIQKETDRQFVTMMAERIERSRQKRLLSGMGCVRGQQDLFPTDGESRDASHRDVPPEAVG